VVPARLGEAVIAADTDAATRRASATTQALADADWSTQDTYRESTGDTSGWLAPVASRPSLAELSAAVLAAFDDLDRMTQPAPPVHGSGAQGAVRVTMVQGRIIECTVSQAWLVNQDEVTLAHSLREAMSCAAAALLTQRAPFVDHQRRLREIVAQARAAFDQTNPKGRR
jgi:hypothetical protein